ncbi:MAG: AAA family ATPase [Actinomycetota bacterium]|nr:AAA family ATPase [Actinomycetota bacterium]
MARHFLALEGAATLETEHYMVTRRAVLDALELAAMAVIHGSAGLGKTYAVDELLGELAVPVVWVSFPSRPTPRLVAATLLEQLTGRASRLDRFSIIQRLVELLAGDARLVVDESQLLTPDCIELLRYLHDHQQTRFALVLVGGNGTWAVLSREPMLASRVFRRVSFAPLTRADVIAAIPAYHSLYTGVDAALLGLIDDLFAHGNCATGPRSRTAPSASPTKPAVTASMSRSRETCSLCMAAVARSAEHTVTLILDAGDELADLEELRRLHSRPYGQVLCEPDPTTTRTGLARHILVALGKHPDMPGSASPWPAVECHLKGERVRDLVLARAHTLTYASLRRVADHAHAAGAHLWLWSATERPRPRPLPATGGTPTRPRHSRRSAGPLAPAATPSQSPTCPRSRAELARTTRGSRPAARAPTQPHRAHSQPERGRPPTRRPRRGSTPANGPMPGSPITRTLPTKTSPTRSAHSPQRATRHPSKSREPRPPS